MKKTTAVSLAVLGVATLPAGILAAGAVAATQKAPENIVATASSLPQFSTLVKLVGTAGLEEILSAKPNKTVFAPTNAAFNRVPKAKLAALGADPKALKDVLAYHVVAGKVPASKVVSLNGKAVKTLNGDTVKVSVKNGKVYLNGNTLVTKTDVAASNGVIHVINRVLLPPAN